MKCNPQRTLNMKYERELEEKEKQQQEYINSLTDEEREKYFAAKQKRQEDALKMISSVAQIAGQLGIKKYY